VSMKDWREGPRKDVELKVVIGWIEGLRSVPRSSGMVFLDVVHSGLTNGSPEIWVHNPGGELV